MKKIRLVFLLIIYIGLLAFTLVMECLGIREPAMRAVANLGTLTMAALGVLLSFLVYRVGRSGNEDKAKEESPPVFDKERYLAFAEARAFTRRETEVGLLVANGYSNLRIAEELFISETTVKKHVTHVYEKCEISGRKAFLELLHDGGVLHEKGHR